jgi:hypothetical protein
VIRGLGGPAERRGEERSGKIPQLAMRIKRQGSDDLRWYDLHPG